VEIPDARTIGVNPAVILGLSEDSCTQARISVESKTSVYDPRKPKDRSDQAISLSLTVRQYPQTSAKFNAVHSFENQCRLLETLMEEKIVPHFVRPLINAIAHRRLS